MEGTKKGDRKQKSGDRGDGEKDNGKRVHE